MAKRAVKAKGRVNYKDVKAKGTLGDEGSRISAGVWGQLRPLDEKAREKVERWGDTLPDLVSPELAGRFEAAYEALVEKVNADDTVAVHQIAAQLMRAWDVLEEQAEAGGHKPLPVDAYAVDIGGRIVCFAKSGQVELRRQHPEWIVYGFEDAARLLCHDFSKTFVEEAFKAFPEASVSRVKRDVEVDWDLGGDEIPF
jgi:hypothetical protein